MSAPQHDWDPVEAVLDLEEADYVEAYLALDRRLQPARRTALACVLLVVAAASFVGWPVSVGVWTLTLPVALLTLVLSGSAARAHARHHFSSTHPAWTTATVVLEETQLRWSSPLLESYRPWSDFNAWLETERLFVVTALDHPQIWPKRAFDPDDLSTVRDLLDEKVTVARSLANPPKPSWQLTSLRASKGISPSSSALLAAFLMATLIVLYGIWWSAT